MTLSNSQFVDRANRLRKQVLKTWSPPMSGMGGPATVAQTAVMQTLAYVFGKEFVYPELTILQQIAIDSGHEKMLLCLDHSEPAEKESANG